MKKVIFIVCFVLCAVPFFAQNSSSQNYDTIIVDLPEGEFLTQQLGYPSGMKVLEEMVKKTNSHYIFVVLDSNNVLAVGSDEVNTDSLVLFVENHNFRIKKGVVYTTLNSIGPAYPAWIYSSYMSIQPIEGKKILTVDYLRPQNVEKGENFYVSFSEKGSFKRFFEIYLFWDKNPPKQE